MNKTIPLKDNLEAQNLFGPNDEYITLIEKEFKVTCALRDERLKINGTSAQIKKATA
jgi:phosphate starvation-inducible protein PhoH